MNRFVLSLLLLSTIHTAHAQTQSYPFDKVFTTQDQRKLLDALRKNDKLEQTDVNVDSANITKPRSDIYTVSGVVIREDGRHQVWVNGESNITGNSTAAGLFIGAPRKKNQSVPLRADDKSTAIKPGQSWIVNSNEVVEGYELNSGLQSPPSETSTRKEEPSEDVAKTN